MEALQILLIVVALAILAEVTYLVVKLPRQTLSKKQARPILVDTSVLIDGRIIAVAKSGFIGDTLVIPRSVVGELQFLADNADHDKRARARYGLDVVSELQNMPHVNVEILQDGSKAEEGVDERLLTLAKKYQAVVCTIDYNLNKVAVVEGITVLNVNELAQSLRMAYLPGEKMILELVQKGQDAHQGVGYLPDGTMVVVENASKNISQSIEIEFIRSLQTAAGKMMFAKPVNHSKPANSPQAKPSGKKPMPQQPQTKPTADPSPKQSSAYHSEHHTTSRPAKKTQQDRQAKRPQQASAPKQFSANPSTQPQPTKQNQRTVRKPAPRRTSSDREAALIDLVDHQDN
jgi:rRNA-processing protein FCF1